MILFITNQHQKFMTNVIKKKYKKDRESVIEIFQMTKKIFKKKYANSRYKEMLDVDREKRKKYMKNDYYKFVTLFN